MVPEDGLHKQDFIDFSSKDLAGLGWKGLNSRVQKRLTQELNLCGGKLRSPWPDFVLALKLIPLRTARENHMSQKN